jgi:hypothetical protein
MSSVKQITPAQTAAAPSDWLSIVRSKVEGLRFGVVQVTVHDGRVVQVERTERTRIDGGCTGRQHAG